ncbi:MAG: hypothetical protein R3E66_17730 [bacterium]
MKKLKFLVFCVALPLWSCSDDKSNPTPVASDAGVDAQADAADAHADGGPTDCLQVRTEDAFQAYSDDVSVEYRTRITPTLAGNGNELSMLFERYNDAAYEGTFELGQGADANFGTCAHCAVVLTADPERAFFATAGTMVLNNDPFSRRLDIELVGLRLAEVTVNPETRESTLVPGGACVEVADFAKQGVFPPPEWTCPPVNYGNGVSCDCNCGAWDPDCASGESNCLPGDPACSGIVGEPLPVVGCDANEVCTVDPVRRVTACSATCDWAGQTGCAAGTCVFDFGVGDGDLCINDPMRVVEGLALGEACPNNGLQVLCNVVNGFAQGYCGPNNICRPVCDEQADCTAAGETCRFFTVDETLGYCGPEPTDG